MKFVFISFKLKNNVLYMCYVYVYTVKDFNQIQSLFIAHCSFKYPVDVLIQFPDGSDEYCQYIIPAYQ